MTGENYQTLTEGVSLFPHWKSSAALWKDTFAHVDNTRWEKLPRNAQELSNALWTPMNHLIDAALATGRKQDMVLTFFTFEETIRQNNSMRARNPGILDNQTCNQTVLDTYYRLEPLQEIAPVVHGRIRDQVLDYLGSVAQNDHAQVLHARKQFIATNTYSDALELMNRLQDGFMSQRPLEALTGQSRVQSAAMRAYAIATNEIQTLSIMGLSGEKPSGFVELFSKVAAIVLGQTNAPTVSPETSSQMANR